MKNTKCVIRRAVTLVAAVLLTTAKADMTLKRPLVQGAEAFDVKIDDQTEAFKWYAPLFLGSHKQWMDVLYDTMSDWTVIDQDYDPDQSDTASPWLDDDFNIYNDVVVGSQFYSGPIFNESMCLIRGEDSTNLCVSDSPMVLAPIGDDLNGYQGVLGLSNGEMNYVKVLKDNDVLEKNVVALDFDSHIQSPSRVTFGSFDPTKTRDDALYVVPNAGHSKWTLKVTSAKFGDNQVQNDEKTAFIDSGNATIQIPGDVYDKVYRQMKDIQFDERVRFREEYEYGQKVRVIKASAECDDIVDDLPTLELKVAPGLTIVIDPKAYVFPPKDDDFYCTISLAKSHENEYRFGMQFLKNFYTVLDYDTNQIMLGSKGKHVEIYGDESLLYKEPEKHDDDVPADGSDKQDEGDDQKPDDEDTGKTDDDEQSQDPETPADDGEIDEDDEDHHMDNNPQFDDDDKPTDDDDDKPIDDDEDEHEDEDQHDHQPDTHDDEEDHHEEEEHHEEEHHEEEHHEEEHHEEEHHDEPKPEDKPHKKEAPAKPKSWLDTHIIDPILNPILSIIHFVQNEITMITNMILSPITMLTHLKF